MIRNENDVIKSIQSGKKDDFVILYDNYLQKIYDFIFYKVWNKSDAQDLTSDVFMKVFEKIWSFDLNRGTKFSAWLYMIANNVIVDHFRGMWKSVWFDIVSYMSDKKDLVKDVENRMKLEMVMEFLETLDEEKKQIFIMRIWNKMSYDEISQVLWKSQDACKQSFSRTLNKVVDKFGVAVLLLFIL